MTDPGDTRPGDIDPDPDPDPDPSIGPCDGQEPGDPIAVESAWIEGSSLVLELSHAGGCAEHDYGICWSEGALQSEPTTAELQVTHDARGDSCEAIVLQEQRFDLGPLLEQHRLEKGNEESEILLVLPGGLLLILPTSGEPPGDAGDVLDPVQALENAAEDMNHCALVDECVGLAWLDCQTRYVNVDEDVEGLQARVNAYIRDNSLGTLCPASCACGVLRCEAGRCETGPGDCGSPPEGETRICL